MMLNLLQRAFKEHPSISRLSSKQHV